MSHERQTPSLMVFFIGALTARLLKGFLLFFIVRSSQQDNDHTANIYEQFFIHPITAGRPRLDKITYLFKTHQ